MITTILIYLVGAAIVAAIARAKGESASWAFFGSLFLTPIIVLIIVLLVKPKLRRCRYCDGTIRPSDIYCEACDRDWKGHTKEWYKNNTVE